MANLSKRVFEDAYSFRCGCPIVQYCIWEKETLVNISSAVKCCIIFQQTSIAWMIPLWNKVVKEAFWHKNCFDFTRVHSFLKQHLLIVITTAQLHSSKLNSGSTQVQILLAACQRFAIVKTPEDDPTWK